MIEVMICEMFVDRDKIRMRNMEIEEIEMIDL